ncbi:Embryogenesis-associated protein EMB8 [Ananas comosus]|uniref:Embryogenesis-associated protein EMB8 n=1 Tax=Ananas comosus TaxID=4615 RepID=A0A199VIQ2_ANACO|nr:Embryogenesis-associated protein EMB8 [Ananas comosus]
MALCFVSSPLELRSPFLPLKNTAFPPRNPRICHDLLLLRRRRRRRRPQLWIDSSLGDIFGDLVSAFPSPNSHAVLGPALGLISGAAIFVSAHRRSGRTNLGVESDTAVGDWILFTSPTPFNRCVLLRCPSVSFEDGGELLDGLNERLVREERHYVNLSRGRIPAAEKEGERGTDDEVLYQRVSVGTDDGGVISMDWPDNLDIEKEHGLDSTILIVPGTAEGSMDRNVRIFVVDSLKHGYFPVVMNPRGCGGSPLTTARLFTAADSDDICTAVQFVNHLRPWTTLMAVGWGYGANMLTKYLAEVGEATPLTAAVCIDNPFDLEEATRSFPHHIALDQKLTSGLIDILRANKEFFQGRAKGFDVQKALSATSVRDFDVGISMVSYGFDSVEAFYAKNSSRQLVGGVKIPSDDGTVPLFSVPRSLIAENPFTSLLLCSCLPSTNIRIERSAVLWCQHLAIEWLSAVELALLKGRHPLLKDVDITINPSKGLAFVDGGASDKKTSSENKVRGSNDSATFLASHNIPNRNSLLKLTQSNPVNGFLVDPLFNGDSRAENKENSRTKQATELDRANRVGDMEQKQDSLVDSDESQVLQTAVVVMNMLDYTMPGTLNDEQKRKVLTAMEQGETLMKALEGAVPEDVRGKLTTAVTNILQTQRANLNLDSLTKIGWTNVASEVKTRIQDKIKGFSTSSSGSSEATSSDHSKSAAGSEEVTQNDVNLFSDNINTHENIGSSQAKASQPESQMESEKIQPNKFEKPSSMTRDDDSEQHRVDQGHEIAGKSLDYQEVVNDANGSTIKDEVKRADSIPEQNTQAQSSISGEVFSSSESTSEHQVIQKEVNGTQLNEEKPAQNMVDQSVQNSKVEPAPQHPSSKPPSISITQALDALTGFDDSTQMAVNSVFGVIENMIDQLEKRNELENADTNKAEDQETLDTADGKPFLNNNVPDKIEERQNGVSAESNIIHSSSQPKNNTNNRHSQENNSVSNYLEGYVLNNVEPEQNVLLNPYWSMQCAAYLHRYLSKQLPMKSSELDTATDLFLDPEEGKWKMADQAKNINDDISDSRKYHSVSEESQTSNSLPRLVGMDNVIEPSYIILETDLSKSNNQSAQEFDTLSGQFAQDDAIKELIFLIKGKLLEALKVEVGRRLGISVIEELQSSLANEMERLATVVSEEVVCNSELNLISISKIDEPAKLKYGSIEGEFMIRTISSAVKEASHLRKVLPVGVIVGTVLASLRNYFHVGVQQDDDRNKAISEHGQMQEKIHALENGIGNEGHFDEKVRHDEIEKSTSGVGKSLETNRSGNKGIMVGAVTAALGASALLAHHQSEEDKEAMESSSVPKGSILEEHLKLGETVQEKSQNNIMSSLAEKAMSVAGPVVPTKSDGEVDHERLVAVLAELGQKGGILRLVGKIALLWGGIRGAMSLTDRLILFLHIAERPLLQRVLGFACMVLVLWSPVVIPLMPTLVQSWTTNSSTGIAGYACIVGLYVSVMILTMLWGKRIRGYDDPLEQYGLELTSAARVYDFLKGLVGGVMVVLCIHSINGLLGYACLSWPSSLPSLSAGAIILLRTYTNTIMLVVRGLVTATGIALVEELLFRSWLPEEIAVDIGYYQAVVLSGIAFSLIHSKSPPLPEVAKAGSLQH